MTIALERVDVREAGTLSTLLDEYVEELSPIFGIERNSDGRFSYDPLPAYWAHPERHFAFLIRADGETAGFALATQGSPASDDANVFDVAEFFVRPGHRGSGVGHRAAELLWRALPGRWTVRVSTANAVALAFWEAAVRAHTNGAFTESQLQGKQHVFRVFHFASGA